MRILWIGAITGGDENRARDLHEFLKKNSFPQTEIVMRRVSRGTESIESRLDEAYAAVPIIEEVWRAEREGFDACVIGCAGDAGVGAAKEVSSIPVIGPGEASMLISQMIGRKVVVLTSLPERIPSIEEKISRFIPGSHFVVYPTSIPVIEFQKDTDRTVHTLVGIIKQSIDKDRVDTAILLCLGMQGLAERVQKEVRIPVIDPSLAALQMAQVLVKMKLSQAKGAYPFPPEKKRFL